MHVQRICKLTVYNQKDNKFKLDGCIVWSVHNTKFGWLCLAISNRWFIGPTRVLNANDISIASAVFLQGSVGDRPTERPTDHATQSVTIGGIYVRSTAMWFNNNSISRLLDWFPCF